MLAILHGEPAVRRRARKEEVETTAGARQLIARLTADRLLVADRTEEGVIVIGLAHEAMLASWLRLAQWVERNRESLKVRGQVAADASRWIENSRNPDYLYDAGLPLEKARAAQRDGFLDPEERKFVDASALNAAARASRHITVLRRWLGALGALAIIALVAGAAAWVKQREADGARRQAENARQYLIGDLRDSFTKKTRPAPSIMAEIEQQSEQSVRGWLAYANESPSSDDPARGQAANQRAEEITKELLRREPKNPRWLEAMAFCLHRDSIFHFQLEAKRATSYVTVANFDAAYDEAIRSSQYAKEALALQESINNVVTLGVALNQIALIHQAKKDDHLTLKALEECLNHWSRFLRLAANEQDERILRFYIADVFWLDDILSEKRRSDRRLEFLTQAVRNIKDAGLSLSVDQQFYLESRLEEKTKQR